MQTPTINKDDIQKCLSEAYTNLFFLNENELTNPLDIPEEFQETPELYIMYLLCQPEYISFTCKYILKVEILPMQAVFLQQLFTHKFPMFIGSRGCSKSFTLAIYVILKLILEQKRKILICGAGFRQSKIVFQYCEQIINNSPILKDLFGSDWLRKGNEYWEIKLGNSYCRAIPIGPGGEKIRGQRATEIICDEQATMQIEVFETVISMFAAVSASPAKAVMDCARRRLAEKWGIELEEIDEYTVKGGNQIVLAGTAYYDFNHFSQYHKRWLAIINSRGDIKKLKEIFGEKYQEGLDYRDYCVIRMPIELVPEDFMDKAQIVRARATMTESNYLMEMGACFCGDSDGFFKKTLLEQCTVDYEKTFVFPSGLKVTPDEIFFEPEMAGSKHKKYVFGVDPASRVDNFSIVVLELGPGYRKIVYCWVTNEKDHREKIKMGMSNEHNYYNFCARKLRELIRVFPCERIALDSQGGGIAVMESLRDPEKLRPGERPIIPIMVPGEKQDSDMWDGERLIEIFNGTAESWTSESNHGMKKDFEDKVLLFPYIDAISISMGDFEEEELGKEDNTFNQLIFNINQLKEELITIVVTETPSGREHFDTPEIKTNTGKKGRLRKDRYSALLMANYAARRLGDTKLFEYSFGGGGFAQNYSEKDENKKEEFFVGPEWLVKQLNALYR